MREQRFTELPRIRDEGVWFAFPKGEDIVPLQGCRVVDIIVISPVIGPLPEEGTDASE